MLYFAAGLEVGLTEHIPSVDVVIPVYNEQVALPPSIGKLTEYLERGFPYRWRIVIADNASTDRTPEVGSGLAAADPHVSYLRIPQKGRGRALRAAWLGSQADVVSYMDVDLSTGLDAFLPLVDAIVKGPYDVAIGSRLAPGARVVRQWKREIISRIYNLMVLVLFPRKGFRDAQCGFKAVSRRAADALVPLVVNNEWFFDSELLLRAGQRGYRIAEIPVEWVEDMDSRVNVVKTALEDIRGLVRVRLHPLPRSAAARPRPA
jgi:glycosyltransferase involved in cell wall biosynthesis